MPMTCMHSADVGSSAGEIIILKCTRCDETSSIRVVPGVAFAKGAAFLCRKCAGYTEPKRRRRLSPNREVLWSDLSFRTPDGKQLSGEAAVEVLDHYLNSEHDRQHVTSPLIRAHTRRERESGEWHQEILSHISSDDLPRFDAALNDMLDPDERWVMSVRAMRISRERYLARLSGTEQLRFQAAWRRVTRKMALVRQALRKQAALKSVEAAY